MPLNSRDLWLVLKAQDQTYRALNTFSRNVRNAGDTVAMAQLQARKAAALGAIAQKRLSNEVLNAANSTDIARQSVIKHWQALNRQTAAVAQAEVAQMSAQKTVIAQTAASLKAAGATKAQIDAVKSMAGPLNDEITRRKLLIAQLQADTAAQQANVNKIQEGINARKTQMATNQNYIAQQRKVIAGIDDEIKQVEAHNKAMQEAEKHTARMANTLQQASQTATAMGFVLSAMAVAGVVGIKAAIDTAVEYERQVRLTATQVSNFSGNLDELGNIGRRVANQIAVPFKDVQTALYDIFSSIDVSVADSEKFLTSFAKAAVAGQSDLQSVSRGTIGIMNAFHLSTGDLNKILDIQFKLVQKGIGTYDEWADRFGKVSPSAQRAGQSIETMAAALAAATRFGVPAAQAATSVARVFDAFSNPKAITGLKKLGISVLDAKGNFRDFGVVMGEFRTALQKIPGEGNKVAAILDVFKGAGGTIEARKFLNTLLLSTGGMELFNEMLKETSNSSGAMEKAYGLMASSTASKTQLLQNKWDLLKESLGRSLAPIFGKVVDWLGKMLDKFTALSPHVQRMVAYAIALATAFAGIAGPLLIIVGGVAAVVAAFVTAGTAIFAVVGFLAALVTGIGLAAGAFVLLWTKSDNFRTIVKNIADDIGQMKDTVVGFATSVKDNFEKYVMPPLENIKTYIEDTVLPAWRTFRDEVGDKLVKAFQNVADALEKHIQPAMKQLGDDLQEKVLPAIQKVTEIWIEHRDEIMKAVGAIIFIMQCMMILMGVLDMVFGSALGKMAIGAILAFAGALAGAIAIISKTIEILDWVGEQLGKLLKILSHWPVQAIQAMASFPAMLGGLIMDAAGRAGTAALQIGSRVLGALSGVAGDAFNAGQHIVTMLIDGLTTRLGDLRHVASLVAGAIADAIPHSPVKRGPLKVLNNGYAGGKIVSMLADGMTSRLGMLQNAAYNVGGTIASGLGADLAQNSSTQKYAGGRTVNQNFTINTQEIDPRKNSAELGWQLQGML